MALISEFVERPSDRNRRNPSTTACGWRAFRAGGETLLQLDTYGSADREIPGKVSQSIQLDRAAAEDLLKIITRAFPDLRRTPEWSAPS